VVKRVRELKKGIQKEEKGFVKRKTTNGREEEGGPPAPI